MAWQIEPPADVHEELHKMGEIELHSLMSDVKTWITDGDWDDIALARGISERGHSDDFSYWLLKEVRMRDIDAHKSA
jgi:hypothetical protein